MPSERAKSSARSTSSRESRRLALATQPTARPWKGPSPQTQQPTAPDVFEKVRSGLVRLGFKRAQAERAVQQLRVRGVEPRPEPLLRAAIAVLTA